MSLLIRLATRNLLRNTRRTLITVTTVSGGLALMIAGNNWANGMYQDMIRTGVSTLAGHVVVQGEGYQAERSQGITVPEANAVTTALHDALPSAVVVQRLFVEGLLTSPAGSAGLMANAVDPLLEPRVSTWSEKVVEGGWLAEERDIVVGALVAETLQVGVGDKVVLMSQRDDEVKSRLFRVKGILRTGSSDIDGALALISVPAGQKLLEVDDRVSQVSVHLPDPRDTREATRVAAAALAGRPVEVLDWKHALPELVASIEMDAGSNNVMMFAMGVIVAMGVLNTVLMSVLERIHEFGVMRAVGMKARQVRRLVLMEGLMLGIGAVLLGDALGLLITWPLAVWGVDLSSLAGEQMSWGGVAVATMTYAEVDWERLVAYSIAGVLLTVLASVYPAWKASSLAPVDAINHL